MYFSQVAGFNQLYISYAVINLRQGSPTFLRFGAKFPTYHSSKGQMKGRN